jgi:hypothetical protein
MKSYMRCVSFAHALNEMRGSLMAADSNAYFVVRREFPYYFYYCICCKAYDQSEIARTY